MLGSASNEGVWARQMVQPDEIGTRSTQSIYLTVADAASLYQTAKAAEATIVMELAETPKVVKAFGCRDLEGHHLWSIGEYDPWQPP